MQELRNKLKITFLILLTAILFVCGSLFFIAEISFRQTPSRFFNLIIIVGAFTAVICAALWLLWRLIDPLLRCYQIDKNSVAETSATSGDGRDTEVGPLQTAVVQVNSSLRQRLDELKNYGEHTQKIVEEANNNVVILYSLLQINSLIQQDALLKEIYEFTLTKLVQFKSATWALIVLRDQYDTLKICAYHGLPDKIFHILSDGGSARVFDLLLLNKNGWVIDEHAHDIDSGRVRSLFNTANMLFVPIYRHRKIAGFIGLGSVHSESRYTSDDIRLLEMFTRQITIAVENDYLVHHRYRFEMRDALTGLYNRSSLMNKLEEEIKKAMVFQKPCAFLLFSILKGQEFAKAQGQLAIENLVSKIAQSVVDSSGAMNRIARFGDYDFALILPEVNKKQALAMAQEIKTKMGNIFSQEHDANTLSVNVAVAENPIDGICARDLIEKAESLLAKKDGAPVGSAN